MGFTLAGPTTETAADRRDAARRSRPLPPYRRVEKEPHRGPIRRAILSSKYTDDETGLLIYPRRPYSAPLGRFLSRDPIEEEGGLHLYGFVGNQAPNRFDPFGLAWIIERDSSEPQASARPDAQGGTVKDLADKIGLDASEFSMWLAPGKDGVKIPPAGAEDTRLYCYDFKIPNRVIAYWADEQRNAVLEWYHKWYADWNPSITYLRRLGFNVTPTDHVNGTIRALESRMELQTQSRILHGVYYWGHGNPDRATSEDYIAGGIAQPGDITLDYTTVHLSYKLALALMFNCDSDSAEPYLKASSVSAIFEGQGFFVPWPFLWHVAHYVHPGDQGTRLWVFGP